MPSGSITPCRRLLQCLCALAVLIGTTAYADVYGYLDVEGTAHFSTAKLDERYQLFVKGDQQFNSAAFMAPVAQTTARAENRSPLFLYLVKHPNLKKYEPLLDQAAHDFRIEPALLKAIMAAESGFNPTAVSPKGAVGLMQLMPATAERYGLAADARKSIREKLIDPKTNIRLGARYLRDLRQLFPNKPDLVIASYNAGEHAVQHYNNTIPPYPETRNYVQLVTQFYEVYRPALGATVPRPPTDGGIRQRRVQMTIPGRATRSDSVMGEPAAAADRS
ncbi:MAG: lytic transglycosylase domain-containing protein [Burkholderiaceae bacterium]